MFTTPSLSRRAAAVGLAILAAGAVQAGDFYRPGGAVAPGFPADFRVPVDASLGKPVIGFGAAGRVRRTPVIFLHGNDDTPYPTGCATRTMVRVDQFAQYFADNGYATSELWALGYQGDQCDQVAYATTTTGDVSATWLTSPLPPKSSGSEHSVAANVQDLRAFVQSVLRYTGAGSVDIVAHGMGVVLAREWVRQDRAGKLVRRFVAIDGPNGGTLMCSPVAGNPWQMGMYGGYTADTPVCQELGSPDTELLKKLNGARDGSRINPWSTLVVRNGDSSFPYMPWNDGGVTGVPSAGGSYALDIYGNATDFTRSASIRGAYEMTLTGQHPYDPNLLQQSAHAGIAMSPVTWQAALYFLSRK